MERKEALIGIMENHHAAGMYFSSDFKRLSPSYGIDNPVMEFRGCSASVEDIVKILEKESEFSIENLINAFKVAVIPSVVLKTHRAEFENACDDLYYGYGYEFWHKQHSHLSDEDAKIVWNAAFNKMANV